MAKLHRMAKKFSIGERVQRAAMGEDTYNQLHPIGTAMVQQEDAAKAAEKAAQDEQNKPVIPLPDEEELARQRRRQALKRSGRDSTVLTSDTFGPG